MRLTWVLAIRLIFLSHHLSYYSVLAQSEFAIYPQCSQGCFVASASPAGISLTNNPLVDNPKICTNVQYLQLTAKCIEASCGISTLESIAQSAKDNCDSTGSPLVLSVDQLIQLGSSATSTSSSYSPSTTSGYTSYSYPSTLSTAAASSASLASPTSSMVALPAATEHSKSRLSAGTYAGIGIGAAIATIFVVAIVIFYLLRRKHRPEADSTIQERASPEKGPVPPNHSTLEPHILDEHVSYSPSPHSHRMQLNPNSGYGGPRALDAPRPYSPHHSRHLPSYELHELPYETRYPATGELQGSPQGQSSWSHYTHELSAINRP